MAGRNLALWAVLALVCVAGLARGQEFEDDDEMEGSMQHGDGPVPTMTVKGSIVSEQFLKITRAMGVTCRVLVDDGKYSGILRADGSFAVHDVPVGVHFLDVNAVGWHFESVRLEVFAKGTKAKARAFTNNPLLQRSAIVYPLKLSPSTRLNYYVEREKFNPMSYLKNPMVLIVIATMGMAYVMPKMVDNMDEGGKAKIRDTVNSGPMGALKGAAKQ